MLTCCFFRDSGQVSMGRNHGVPDVHGLACIISHFYYLERSPRKHCLSCSSISLDGWMGLPGQFRMRMGNKIVSNYTSFNHPQPLNKAFYVNQFCVDGVDGKLRHSNGKCSLPHITPSLRSMWQQQQHHFIKDSRLRVLGREQQPSEYNPRHTGW